MSQEISDRFVCGDGLEVMRALPDASIDAVIMDPPYCSGAITEAGKSRAPGQGLRSETIQRLGWFRGDNMGTQGLVWLLRAIAFESCRVLKSTGSLLCFCDWRMIPALAPAIESSGLRYQNQLSWDKGHMGLGIGFRTQKEEILHFTNGEPQYYDRGTSNVIKCKRVSKDEREHQTQKPVELIAKLLKVVAPENGLVLDPFAGSGTVAVAARSSRRRFLCIDRDPAFIAIGESRLQNIQAELSID